MGDESDSGYTITLDGSESSLGGGLDFSNTMSDVTFTMDTSTATSTVSVPGATVGGITGGAYTFDVGDHTFDLNTLDEDEINEMCKEYPALKIVWQNFKTMYDLVKQDYKGKKEAGELDDELPF
jgi:hypothetical protein|tara:strand:+ start:818 stop:1189 length:372 start_codon:yes stop_codon:yes gene_type:complete